MKIKKLLPEDVKGNLLGFKDYRKVIKPALKAMLTQHSGLESPTRFIAITNYEYADMKGKKMGLIIAGDQTSAWLKMAKELLKDNKKNVCIGECYVKTGSDGSNILVLQPEKGAAKKNLLKKQLEKSVLKGSPFTVEIGTGGELEEDDPNEAVADEVELADEAVANTSNRDAEIQPQIAALIKEIATGYKDDVLPIVDQIKARKGDESFVAPLEALLNKIDQLQELYDNASEDLQKRLNANALQVFGLAANLEKIKAGNNELIGKSEGEETPANTTRDTKVSKEAEQLSKVNENIPKIEALLSKGITEGVLDKIKLYKKVVEQSKDTTSANTLQQLNELESVTEQLPKVIEIANKIKETLSKLQSQ